jgi:hypothetical protein
VTGIRKDPWANTNRIEVEKEKPSNERDHHLHPELYDKPSDKSIMHARYPELMQQQKGIDKIGEELKKNREKALTRNLQQQQEKQRQLKAIDKSNVKGLKKKIERTRATRKAKKSSKHQSKGRKRRRKD